MYKINCSGIFLLLSALAVFSCADSTEEGDHGNSSGTGGSAGADASCGETRTTFVDTVVAKQTCSADTDCDVYYAPCLQKEAGNCAGIFYVSKSSLDTIKQAQSGYDACVGKVCDAPPFCTLGGQPPACVDGVCGHK